ncbi:septum formation initiator family protein [Rhodococcus sp. D2-41]|uniref:FtsB family cell division protein n=1 Tax=Speluncibacter jeojiensis TaxID=2710754 RepID=UPI00241030C7|nr:septum formation initiator family protein [Rhodococcus sp. D2-41]MDG3012305.1 septum formation initiator family protein [Rhodococcus sp. D2-41]
MTERGGRRPGGSPGGRGSRRAEQRAREQNPRADRQRRATGSGSPTSRSSASRRNQSAPNGPGPTGASGGRGSRERVVERRPRRLGKLGDGPGGLSPRRVVILVLVVCALALTLSMPLRTYFSQRSQVAAAAVEHTKLQGEIDSLQAQNKQIDDPNYVRIQARERLGFVEKGVTPYVVELPGDQQPPVTAPQKTKKPGDPWYTPLWNSISQPLPTPTPAPAPLPPVVPAPATGPNG